MEEKNDYLRLPMAYENACTNPQVVVCGCRHLNDQSCPGTCCLAKQKSGRLETAVQTRFNLN